MPEEQVRCNICGVTIGQGEAKDHASTPAHARRKSELERDLEAARKGQYDEDNSIAERWKGSV